MFVFVFVFIFLCLYVYVCFHWMMDEYYTINISSCIDYLSRFDDHNMGDG